MELLLAIADHEQRIVLQPLIYEDRAFARDIAGARSAPWSWFTPAVELPFTSARETGDENLKLVAPKRTELEDVKNRMD